MAAVLNGRFFFYGTAFVAFLPVALVLLQPDLGSAILLVCIWFGLMWLIGARRLFIATFILFIVAASFVGWRFFLKDYQKNRLITFIDPSRDPLKEGYNVNQSIIAVGAGKLFGRGLGFGSQSQLKFLPEAQTDFIFAVIGEELGLAGAMALLTLFGIIFWRLILMIKRSTDDFISITASGSLNFFFCRRSIYQYWRLFRVVAYYRSDLAFCKLWRLVFGCQFNISRHFRKYG